MLISRLVAAVVVVSVTAAKDFPPACDATCQAAYEQGIAIDSSIWVNQDLDDDAFYELPHNFAQHRTGDLIKWEDIDANTVSTNWSIPSGLSLCRFFYVSEGIDNEPLPATAYVLTPYSNPLGADKPFRAVVWAHGTAGFVPHCAPSNDKGLQYHWLTPFSLAQDGYIVIAPDYSGLGSTIAQGFMYNAGIPHAADASLAVRAARLQLKDTITAEWAIKTAQREATGNAVGGLVGAVSIASALDILKLVPWVVERANGGPLQEIFIPFVLHSIGQLFPIDLSEYMTQELRDLTQLSLNGCLNTAISLLGGLTLKDMYYNNANFVDAPEVKEWEEQYAGLPAGKFAAPMLVLHGEGDFIIPHNNTDRVFDILCAENPNSIAEYKLMPGLDHDGVTMASKSTYFRWIADRFEKKPLHPGCVKTRAENATDRFSTTEQVWISAGQVLVQ
ncbi:Alpha/Beta hydrolase protein [Aspergillus karnatakaensis]|uniref:Alpha/Beta hydrolase protein n=1 Tax=Aspergillus karnatakaensis TaxID=1810916 RepID=UPI003CCD3ADB